MTDSINNLMYTFTNFFDLTIEQKVMILDWRNSEVIRKWMYNTNFVEKDNHLSFIERLENDKTKFYFLVKRNEIPVGVISILDIKDYSGDWGYYIAPDFHNQNLGVEFYYFSLLHFYNKLNFKKVFGYVLKENKSANSFSDLFGFSKELQIKEIGSLSSEFYYREMTKAYWEENIINNSKIKRLLQLTINK